MEKRGNPRFSILAPSLLYPFQRPSVSEGNSAMLTLTDRAVSVLSALCAEEALGLRISVNAGSCSGLQYGMSLEEEPTVDDEILTFGELRVFIDPPSTMWLTGVKVDYIESGAGAGFQFENPAQAAKCSCSGKCG
jgi:iron-sulfur cluster assembly protein